MSPIALFIISLCHGVFTPVGNDGYLGRPPRWIAGCATHRDQGVLLRFPSPDIAVEQLRTQGSTSDPDDIRPAPPAPPFKFTPAFWMNSGADYLMVLVNAIRDAGGVKPVEIDGNILDEAVTAAAHLRELGGAK